VRCRFEQCDIEGRSRVISQRACVRWTQRCATQGWSCSQSAESKQGCRRACDIHEPSEYLRGSRVSGRSRIRVSFQRWTTCRIGHTRRVFSTSRDGSPSQRASVAGIPTFQRGTVGGRSIEVDNDSGARVKVVHTANRLCEGQHVVGKKLSTGAIFLRRFKGRLRSVPR
jgi:hypothetical protein